MRRAGGNRRVSSSCATSVFQVKQNHSDRPYEPVILGKYWLLIIYRIGLDIMYRVLGGC